VKLRVLLLLAVWVTVQSPWVQAARMNLSASAAPVVAAGHCHDAMPPPAPPPAGHDCCEGGACDGQCLHAAPMAVSLATTIAVFPAGAPAGHISAGRTEARTQEFFRPPI
jgi:hypothetical protein